MKYRREHNIHQILEFANEVVFYEPLSNEYYFNNKELKYGDYIIKDTQGNFQLYGSKEFEQNYELVEN